MKLVTIQKQIKLNETYNITNYRKYFFDFHLHLYNSKLN